MRDSADISYHRQHFRKKALSYTYR